MHCWDVAVMCTGVSLQWKSDLKVLTSLTAHQYLFKILREWFFTVKVSTVCDKSLPGRLKESIDFIKFSRFKLSPFRSFILVLAIIYLTYNYFCIKINIMP